MRSRFCKTAIALGALLCSGTLALAQGLGGAGAVQGTVKDATGGVLPGATVVVSNPVSGFKRDTVTDSDVTNPPRIAPRHLFDVAVGADNLLRTTRAKVRLRFSVINLTNDQALYNFLSTFSGTHFVTPRAYKIEFGVTF